MPFRHISQGLLEDPTGEVTSQPPQELTGGQVFVLALPSFLFHFPYPNPIGVMFQSKLLREIKPT